MRLFYFFSILRNPSDLRDHPTNSQSLGRTIRQSPKVFPTSNAALQSRLNRRNNAKQAQSRKREALISSTRIFNGIDGAPRIVAVIPLTEDVKARDTVCALAESLDVPTDDCPEDGLWKLKYPVFSSSRLRQN